MKTNNRITPEGTRDILFSECTERKKIESMLCKNFYRAGYNEVRTPVLEFFDVYNLGADSIPTEQMYKLTDSKGRLLVVRPDSTPPIARLVSTRLRDATLPIRVYYSQETFRSNISMRGRSDQQYQSGIELIGVQGKRADIETLCLAVESLEMCTSEFRFEIGHAGIFKALSEQLPVSADEREEIRLHIESKNYATLSERLEGLGELKAAQALRQLPRLFGGLEVLDEASRLIDCPDALEAIEYLREIFTSLSSLGLGDKIIIDLGLVHHNEYYTGIVFSGYTHGSGDMVLSGGRYDNLLGTFGVPMPACGFGVNIDSIVKSSGVKPSAQVTVPEVLVHAEPGFELLAVKRASQLRRAGTMCELSVSESEQDAISYAGGRGIAKVLILGENERAVETSR